MPAATNYLVGARSQWHTGVANYARVRYQSVYPGIDVVYYGNQNQLEYDFVLAPGANPDAIRLNFHGDVKVSLTPAGDLALDSNGAQILQKAPVIYQDNRPIKGRYTLLARNQVGFRLDRYDRTRPLVIDPILLYCTYMGSSGADRVTAMKMGPNGRLYITGSTTTGEMQYIDGAYNNFSSGLTDIFLAIVDTTANGNYALKYFSYLGGANLDTPLALEVDSNGVAYLAGSTTSVDFPMAGNSVQTTGAASVTAGFVAVIDPSLYGGDSLVYSTYLGGTDGNTSVNGIALDNAGFMYVIGTTKATDYPLTTSGYAQTLYGRQDAFLAKIDRNSTSMVYSTYLGGELTDEGRSIAVGSNGKVYFAASTTSAQFPMEGPSYRQNSRGGVDIIVGMMDMTQVRHAFAGLLHLPGRLRYRRGPQDRARRQEQRHPHRLHALQRFSGHFRCRAAQSPAAIPTCLSPWSIRTIRRTSWSTPPTSAAPRAKWPTTSSPMAPAISTSPATPSPPICSPWALPSPDGAAASMSSSPAIKPGTPGRAGLLYCTYLGATGTYVGSAMVIGPDGSIYVGGYGNIGLPSSSNGNGFGGGTTDGFITVMK